MLGNFCGMPGGLSLSNIYQKILVILSAIILVSLSKCSSQMPTSATSQQKQGLVSFIPYCAVVFLTSFRGGGARVVVAEV